MVKSAVGTSRIKANKIQVRTLIEKSQANGLSNTQQIFQQEVPNGARSRHLQTQGCQRSGLKMKYSLPPAADPRIISGANSVSTKNSKELIMTTSPLRADDERTIGAARHNSFTCSTPAAGYLENQHQQPSSN